MTTEASSDSTIYKVKLFSTYNFFVGSFYTCTGNLYGMPYWEYLYNWAHQYSELYDVKELNVGLYYEIYYIDGVQKKDYSLMILDKFNKCYENLCKIGLTKFDCRENYRQK